MPYESIKLDDLFILGSHRLICGDCTNADTITRLVTKPIDLILTDPPYGVAVVESKQGFGGSDHVKILGDHLQSDQEYLDFTVKWLKAVTPHLSTKNSIYVFNADKMLLPLLQSFKDEKLHFAQLLIWVKSQPVPGRLDYLPQHELIIYGWKGTHDFRKSKDKSVIFCPKPSHNIGHPTVKPITLLRRLILNSSKSGAIVFDGFGGSGSTLLACEQTKRICLMAERSPEYCRLIIERFEKLTGIEAVREES